MVTDAAIYNNKVKKKNEWTALYLDKQMASIQLNTAFSHLLWCIVTDLITISALLFGLDLRIRTNDHKQYINMG